MHIHNWVFKTTGGFDLHIALIFVLFSTWCCGSGFMAHSSSASLGAQLHTYGSTHRHIIQARLARGLNCHFLLQCADSLAAFYALGVVQVNGRCVAWQLETFSTTLLSSARIASRFITLMPLAAKITIFVIARIGLAETHIVAAFSTLSAKITIAFGAMPSRLERT
jgi:hypothetical protein